MNFFRKNLKWIITIIVVTIVTTGISVYATGQYLASQVEYNKNGQANVSDALDDLYNKSVNYILPTGTKTINSIGEYDVKNFEKVIVQGMTSENVAVFPNFQITGSSSKKHYDLGFNPKFVFMVLSSNFYIYGVTGDSSAYWISKSGGESGADLNCFSVGNNGFYLQHGSSENVTLYAIK